MVDLQLAPRARDIPTGVRKVWTGSEWIDDADGGSAVPAGVIVMWGGLLSAIPTGWALCDGAGGRPDLRGMFIKGSAVGIDPGVTGGSATHTHDAHPALSHTGGAVDAHSGAGVDAHSAHTGSGVDAHSGAGVGPHSNHVFTQATAHTVVATKQGTAAGNVVTTATHTGSGVDAHSAHSVTQAVNHVFTQAAAHANHVFTQAVNHVFTQPSQHAAQSHVAASNEPVFYSLAFIIKT